MANEQGIFHLKSELITSAMQHPGGIKFQQHIVEQKAKLLEKLARNPSGVEVASVSKQAGDVTIVVLNKDEIQHELKFWTNLEIQIKDWIIEAARKEGE